MDKRIGMDFLNAGIGYGGSCFPKDVLAFKAISKKVNIEPTILNAVDEINSSQRERFINKIKVKLGNIRDKTIAILGLAFKPNTDDIRSAPSLDIIQALKDEGANLRVYDPEAMNNVKHIFPDLYFGENSYDTIAGSVAAIFVTEWKEFKELDLLKIKNETNCDTIFDGRNIFQPCRMELLGFKYYSIGRNLMQ